jgi:C4-dicarboxylate transporter DctQ subunit
MIYLASPLGSTLMCFRFLQVAWSFARTGELPHHDHSHVEGLDEEIVNATEALEEYGEHKLDENKHDGGVK